MTIGDFIAGVLVGQWPKLWMVCAANAVNMLAFFAFTVLEIRGNRATRAAFCAAMTVMCVHRFAYNFEKLVDRRESTAVIISGDGTGR